MKTDGIRSQLKPSKTYRVTEPKNQKGKPIPELFFYLPWALLSSLYNWGYRKIMPPRT
jgi:hypothetical protein